MKSFAVTVLLDGPDQTTVETEVFLYLSQCLVLENIQVEDVEEIEE